MPGTQLNFPVSVLSLLCQSSLSQPLYWILPSAYKTPEDLFTLKDSYNCIPFNYYPASFCSSTFRSFESTDKLTFLDYAHQFYSLSFEICFPHSSTETIFPKIHNDLIAESNIQLPVLSNCISLCL